MHFMMMLLQMKFFAIDVIGSDQKQHFTQVEVADIIEARMEEIFPISSGRTYSCR